MEPSTFKYRITNLLKDIIKEEDELTCSICYELVFKKEVLQCKEGHWNCKECWIKSLSTSKKCMQCRVPVASIDDLSRNRFAENLLSNKVIYCPYSLKFDSYVDESDSLYATAVKDEPNGCKETFKINQLDSHLQSCKFKFINCTNNGCKEIIRLNQLDNHIDEACNWVTETCKHCGKSGILEKTESEIHYSVCPKVIVQCSECTQHFERKETSNHFENVCSEGLIPCRFVKQGCDLQIKRCDVLKHYEEVNHSKYMIDEIDKIDKLLMIVKEQEYKISLLTESIKSLTSVSGKPCNKKTKYWLDEFTIYENGYKINDGIEHVAIQKGHNLPISFQPSVNCLLLPDGFNDHSIKSLPKSIMFLVIFDIKIKLEPGTIPNSIKWIIFGDGFSQKIDKGTIPNGVTYVYIGNVSHPLNIIDSLPDSVTEVSTPIDIIDKIPQMFKYIQFDNPGRYTY